MSFLCNLRDVYGLCVMRMERCMFWLRWFKKEVVLFNWSSLVTGQPCSHDILNIHYSTSISLVRRTAIGRLKLLNTCIRPLSHIARNHTCTYPHTNYLTLYISLFPHESHRQTQTSDAKLNLLIRGGITKMSSRGQLHLFLLSNHVYQAV